MKLEFHGHNQRYVVEQSLMNLFPGELPVYEPVQPGEDTWAIVSCREDDRFHVTVELSWKGRAVPFSYGCPLAGTDFDREGQRRHAIAVCFYLAAREFLEAPPPWGILTGVRPDKPATWLLEEGKTPAEAARMLEEDYFVTPARAALAAETASAAAKAAGNLGPRDIAVYIGIPFCPTRCAYCSFVSQSVERSFALVPPYVDALEAELRAGGEMVRNLGLRVRAMYMGGGTPTTLSADQLDRLLSQCEASLPLENCTEYTVEAGRPDTITREKLETLKAHRIGRISINPQTMEDGVLRTMGRAHTAAQIEEAMELAQRHFGGMVNMDLIAGLPADTLEGFGRTLDRVLAMEPANITVHTLALKKGSRLTEEGGRLCVPETVEAMLSLGGGRLREAGYEPYYLYRQKYMSGSFENVGWTRPGAVCAYNIVMMEELQSVLSLGAGGITKLVDFDKRKIVRLSNPKYAKEYLESWEKVAEGKRTAARFQAELAGRLS